MNQGGDILLVGGASEASMLEGILAPKVQRVRAASMPQDLSEYRGIVDANHCFDGRASCSLYKAALAQGVRYVRFLRPAWEGHSSVDRVMDAMGHLPENAVVFSATGWPSLPEFAGFRGRRVFLRQSEKKPDPVPFRFVQCVFGTPPYSVHHEIALFRALGVTHLMCRNLGGDAGRSKLDAAMHLGIDVILVNRPAPPHGAEIVQTPEQVLNWTGPL